MLFRVRQSEHMKVDFTHFVSYHLKTPVFSLVSQSLSLLFVVYFSVGICLKNKVYQPSSSVRQAMQIPALYSVSRGN